jgi:hypothetical protein
VLSRLSYRSARCSERDSNPRPLRPGREPVPFRPAATRNARAGFEPAFPSFLRLVRTAAPPPRCVTARFTTGKSVAENAPVALSEIRQRQPASLGAGPSVVLRVRLAWLHLCWSENGQQKGRPGGSPSRYVGGYAPYGLAHAPPREGRDGRPIAHEGDDGKPEARAALAARRHGRERCRAGVREGRVEEESHTGGVRPSRIGQSPNGRKGYMTNFCDV